MKGLSGLTAGKEIIRELIETLHVDGNLVAAEATTTSKFEIDEKAIFLCKRENVTSNEKLNAYAMF